MHDYEISTHLSGLPRLLFVLPLSCIVIGNRSDEVKDEKLLYLSLKTCNFCPNLLALSFAMFVWPPHIIRTGAYSASAPSLLSPNKTERQKRSTSQTASVLSSYNLLRGPLFSLVHTELIQHHTSLSRLEEENLLPEIRESAHNTTTTFKLKKYLKAFQPKN
jgi:hypothetical protein